MDQLIRSTTEHFLSMLEDQREFFSPDELVEAGLPDFLVKRIEMELIRNLQGSVNPPESDWADMSARAVQKAWDHFLKAIHDEIRLPASYASSVLESSLADIVEMMVTPRAFLPDYIFGNERELDRQTIRERCEWIVVYTYFSTALPRFMDKKQREKLTKEQADRLIERLDERVTAHYTSLNWAQLFEPWFALFGEKVEPGLFAKFFRDKGKPGVARLFEAETNPLNRTRLIEILSRPQLDEIDDEFADFGEDLLSAKENRMQTPEAVKEKDIVKKSEDPKEEKKERTSEEKKIQEKKAGEKMDEEKKAEEKMTEGKKIESEKESESLKSDKKGVASEEAKPVNVKTDTSDAKATHVEKNAGATKADEKTKAEGKKEADQKNESDDSKKVHPADGDGTRAEEREREKGRGIEKDKEKEKDRNKTKSEKGDIVLPDEGVGIPEEVINLAESEEKKPETDDDDEGNLISRFQKSNGNDEDEPPLHSTLKTGSDQIDEEEEESIPLYSRIRSSDEEEEEDEDKVPIWQRFTRDETDADDKTGAGDSASKKSDEVTKVRSYVGDMEEEFIEELFGGDQGAFLEAIEQISRLNSWREAGNYISREVFDRNMIDIYSDTAIYFTDRMQTYFLERK